MAKIYFCHASADKCFNSHMCHILYAMTDGCQMHILCCTCAELKLLVYNLEDPEPVCPYNVGFVSFSSKLWRA